MNDTPPEVQALYVSRIMQRTPYERLVMASRMFAAARALMLAGMANAGRTDPSDVRKEIFERLYGADFSEAQRKAILRALGVRGTAPAD